MDVINNLLLKLSVYSLLDVRNIPQVAVFWRLFFKCFISKQIFHVLVTVKCGVLLWGFLFCFVLNNDNKYSICSHQLNIWYVPLRGINSELL